ncbi:MupA/Atu3671 family FMN-dependent luciferase-like monooxygenase [Rhizobium sp. GN54]|uniref:MupA/Atu3671 family FMN-dependent luciferase-like monooxygenase n=1 Tax=Rhizobium sp. GN54 TaxID=2898150 RepID=UPI001E64ECCD|nr:MupA/Atu3671 family FMN-dependent luciferase-like monooxygenase [Rhizobium sp. GN54]MCD2182582.1 LLM class flavin-dependent oxidoreductase [Rhizobium sp. GN54]
MVEIHPTAIFFGNGTLLLRCAEAFRAAGGRLAGIVTTDPQIAAWAEAEDLSHGAFDEAEIGQEADYIFSVANLTVLSPATLRRARLAAVNFHDGPLPARAGSNVPAWSVIEGAAEHAVTWHEMTGHVDAGRVLKQRRFQIGPNDTAFSLNARCYEAGFESFCELLPELMEGRCAPSPVTGERVWYAKAKRPEALGTLDFAAPAGALCRMVRGLNFGGYVNPLGLAKLWTGTALLTVGRLEIVTDVAGTAGAVVASDGDMVTVMAADAGVRLGGLADLSGRPVDPVAAGLMPGVVLPSVRDCPAPEPAETGKAEPEWEAELRRAVPALPPYPLSHTAGSGTALLETERADADTLAAAWLAWIAGLTGQARATITCLEPDAQAPRPSRVPWLSDRRPVTLDITAGMTPHDATEALRLARQAAFARAPMAADLPLRLADAEARQRAQQALGVVLATRAEQGPEGAAVQLCTDPPSIRTASGRFAPAVLAALAADFSVFLDAFVTRAGAPLATLPLGREMAAVRNDVSGVEPRTIHAMIADICASTPDAPALEAGATRLNFRELDARAARLAGALAERGAAPGVVVGLCLERSVELVVAMLAILKTGAAYLPLDPSYPAERIGFMLEDSGAPIVVASRSAASRLALDPGIVILSDAVGPAVTDARGMPGDLAYLIYTSGSTGRPKGVMIAHRNVANFFAGMDATVPLSQGARLLAVTSVSFDISVLEILWTLARGATLVLQADGAGEGALPAFSLFYFASEAAGSGHQAYRLLLEGARFADENGFEAIWTPERHFHAFGGLYPNPAISSAALAGLTKNVKLRAGSTVMPLHHPVRAAEDWALVDNLSNGRAGLALASGWQPNDFLLRPEAFSDRKEIMLGSIETLRTLWRGEAMAFSGHDGEPVEIRIHPRPVQRDMPLWLTAAGNPETFEAAGRLGCGVLTHLLGQTLAEVEDKIRAYRVARAKAGHAGPGHVVLMLHTFIGEDEEAVLAAARQPMKSYLKSAVDLVRRAAWTFPTIVERAGKAGMTPQEVFEKEELSASELDALLDHAFERYYRTAGLFGTPETAGEIVRNVAAIGVDEIACLIDFGVEAETALANLPNIRRLMDRLQAEGGISRKASVAEDIVAGRITHLQCTPSMATYLAGDPAGRQALGRLDCMMVGGEAFPPDLARSLRAALPGTLLNMYGPTETTIWSSVARLDAVGDRVPLGAPIANTDLSVRSPAGLPLPNLIEGELWIGGAGLARGYWGRPELTAERFVDTPEGRYYRTGDLVRRHPDGTLEFLGRIDGQVKIRGHRIELGEIEALLASEDGVRQAAVRAVEYGQGDVRLVAYVTAGKTQPVVSGLRALLATKLPDFMVPSQIVVLERMPLTPNGKIDRKALPVPQARAERGEMTTAEGDIEAGIVEIWREALGLDEVSVTENFFDLGGHSLLVVQVQRRMREKLGREVAITDLFRFPTIRAIAAHLAGGAAATASAADRGAARAAARLARFGRR